MHTQTDSLQKEEAMSANQMDYFEQKPEMDLKPFFKGKGIQLSDAEPISRPAPPPKDTYWVAPVDTPVEDGE